ncbi:DnaJ subfamily C protein [Acrasis kona]|uniref:DnaJ subfamily C protein n=1 Tax=Acrasis kona TaxID=1008807 RepID=A0AAW2ZCZ2_9EUKA
MSSQLKYNLSVAVLSVCSSIYDLYKYVKSRPNIGLGIGASIVVIMALLIVFREPVGLRFDYDPYEVLGVEKNATSRQVASAYRRLVQTMHPDKNVDDEPEVARAKFIKIRKSKEILSDEKQRSNFDKYGNPGGPGINLFDYETYPDFIINPGKKFLAFYGLLTLIVFLLPIFALVLVPGLQSPPQWIRDSLYEQLLSGEKFLSEEKSEAVETFDSAEKAWNGLVAKFPEYKKSIWGTILTIQILARQTLTKIVLNTITAEEIKKATDTFNDIKKDVNHRSNLKEPEVLDQIKHEMKDLKNALSDCRKPGANKLALAVSSIKK